MLRDFTTEEHCNFLWISELLQLKQNSAKQFIYLIKNKKSVVIKFVTVFGTIIEVKQLGSKGFLYSVDDGTGVILCNHNDQLFTEIVDAVSEEYSAILNKTFSLCKRNSTVVNETGDDTVFNDKTIQDEEKQAIQRNQLMGTQSLWSDILESFSPMVSQFNVGDTVYIHGKLYSYFKVNQMYINTIRTMDIAEEIVRLTVKLNAEQKDEVTENEGPCHSQTVTAPKRKFSGIITFDHVSSNDMKVPPARHTVTPKRKSDDSDFSISNKRLSIVSPQLHGIITFDSLADFRKDCDEE